MKLRIRGNSVRIRLTRGEVARLGSGETIEQTTEFSKTDRFISSIGSSPNITMASAELAAGRINVLFPSEQIESWWNSDVVSVTSDQPIESGRSLQILVEKDFQCLHSRQEENSDSYPNPREGVTISDAGRT
jgi:hypothetical protein